MAIFPLTFQKSLGQVFNQKSDSMSQDDGHWVPSPSHSRNHCAFVVHHLAPVTLKTKISRRLELALGYEQENKVKLKESHLTPNYWLDLFWAPHLQSIYFFSLPCLSDERSELFAFGHHVGPKGCGRTGNRNPYWPCFWLDCDVGTWTLESSMTLIPPQCPWPICSFPFS